MTIEERIRREAELKHYSGEDRIVLAEDKRLEIEAERKTRRPFRAATGLARLDEILDGFRRGQLVIISGPPKMGKTAVAQNFTKSFIAQGHQCVWFSYEVSYEELFEKFPMEKLDFYVPNILQSGNLDWVEKRIIEAKQKHDAAIVFIDHLDFLRDPDVLKRGMDMNLSSYIGGIVQRVKRIAVEQNVLLFLLCHIRKNKWTSRDLPSSEELRDSGQIAQLADIVMMIMRKRAVKESEEVYAGTQATIGVIENRHNGKTRKVQVQLVGNKFLELYEPKAKAEEEWV